MNKILDGIKVGIDYDSISNYNIHYLKEGINFLIRKQIPYYLISWKNNFSSAQLLKEINIEEVKESNIFLPHKVLREKIEEYKKNKNLIIIGGIEKEIAEIMKEHNFNSYITSNEITKIFPEIFPYYFNLKKDINITNNVENRIGLKLNEFKPIKAIIQLTKITDWAIDLQLYSDLLISPNGIPGKIRKKEQKQFIDYHLFEKDSLYQKKYNDKIDNGLFFPFLNHLYTKKYNTEIKYIDYNKKKIFDYFYLKENKPFYFITSNIKNAEKSSSSNLLTIYVGESEKKIKNGYSFNNIKLLFNQLNLNNKKEKTLI